MSAAARGVGGAYVRHPITDRLYVDGSAEAEKILADEIHATRARMEVAEAAEIRQDAEVPKAEAAKPVRKRRKKTGPVKQNE